LSAEGGEVGADIGDFAAAAGTATAGTAARAAAALAATRAATAGWARFGIGEVGCASEINDDLYSQAGGVLGEAVVCLGRAATGDLNEKAAAVQSKFGLEDAGNRVAEGGSLEGQEVGLMLVLGGGSTKNDARGGIAQEGTEAARSRA
jgi:hypothetical protein